MDNISFVYNLSFVDTRTLSFVYIFTKIVYKRKIVHKRLGRTYVEKENVFMPKDDTPSCFYTPGQVLATGSMEACVGGPGLCPATMPNFAGSDISNKVPNNGKPTEFCDNFYRDWFGAVTELRLYCINDKAVTGHGELRGIQGRYGPPPGGNRQGS